MKQTFAIDPEVFAKLRERRVMSVSDLARKAGCATETIRHIARGQRRVNGELKRHRVTARTTREIAEALAVETRVLLMESRQYAAYMESRPVRAEPLVKAPTGDLIDPLDQIKRFRDDLAFHEASGDVDGAAAARSMIKQFCAFYEAYGTRSHAEEVGDRARFMYGESALVDIGLNAYLSDPCWSYLINTAGRAFHRYGGRFDRILYITRTCLKADDFAALMKVVRLHQRNGHHVHFVDQDALGPELMNKRNLGIVGSGLVAVTDVVQWDLDICTAKGDLSRFTDQYDAYEPYTVLMIDIEDSEDQVIDKLMSLFRDFVSADDALFQNSDQGE